MLFTFAGGRGHADPLVPFARAAEAAGHTVAFAGQASTVPALVALGFDSVAVGPDTGRSTMVPLVAPDPEHEDEVLRDFYAGTLARRRAAELSDQFAEWQPDVVVCDEADFGAMITAEKLALPYASVLVAVAGSFVRRELVGPPLHALRSELDLAPDPDLEMLSLHLVLSPCPPSFRDPAYPLPATGRAVRPAALEPDEHAPLPAWMQHRPAAPTVYVTLGTVFNLESGDLLRRLVEGAAALPVDVVATVGTQRDPAELGPQPPNVRVVRYVPQAALLPHCDAVVSHAGSGSVMGALAHGLPSVLVPMGADQPHNAARCAALGVALALDPMTATPGQVRHALSTVLTEPAYRARASAMRGEAVGLPDAAHAVRMIETLDHRGA